MKTESKLIQQLTINPKIVALYHEDFGEAVGGYEIKEGYYEAATFLLKCSCKVGSIEAAVEQVERWTALALHGIRRKKQFEPSATKQLNLF